RAEEINETTKQWVRHRSLKLVFNHAEVVNCDIYATANTLKSQDTPNLLSPISNIRAVTSCTREHRRHGSKSVRAESLPPCSTVPQRLRSAKVSIRSRASAYLRLVSIERPHRNLTVPRIRPGDRCGSQLEGVGHAIARCIWSNT